MLTPAGGGLDELPVCELHPARARTHVEDQDASVTTHGNGGHRGAARGAPRSACGRPPLARALSRPDADGRHQELPRRIDQAQRMVHRSPADVLLERSYEPQRRRAPSAVMPVDQAMADQGTPWCLRCWTISPISAASWRR